jgi:hypothetical protein
MDLLINYGTNASAGGQSVIAEIELTQATTTQYNYNISFGEYWTPNGIESTYPTYQKTNKIEIINNSIILSQKVWSIHFWNNSTYLGYYTDVSNSNPSLWADNINKISSWQINNGNVVIPNGATHFALNGLSDIFPNGNNTTNAQFQNVSISSSTPAAATTTFYDSYPGGNVIGTTAGTDQGTYLQIDPPTGKRIKQIALKGL